MRIETAVLAVSLATSVLPASAATPLVRVVSQGAGTIAEIDTIRGMVVRRFDVGQSPATIAGDGDTIAIAYPDARAIGVLDTRHPTSIRMLPFDGQPFGVAADGAALYVSDWSGGRVAKIDASDGRVEAAVAVGRSPAGLVLDRSAHRLYVADRESDDVAVVDAVDLHAIATIAVGKAPYALALSPDRGRLYVADVRDGDVSVVDTGALARVATVAVGAMPYGVAVTPDGAQVLVTNQHSGTLSVVDAETLAVVAIVAVGRYPEGVVCDATGRAYVANWFSDDVSVVDLAGRREVARIAVGEGPRGFAAAGPN